MQITLEVPDDLAAGLAPPGQDPARAGLGALALAAYRERRLTAYQLRKLLGISSRYDLDGFLKEHNVYDFTIEEFEKDLASIRELREEQKVGHPA